MPPLGPSYDPWNSTRGSEEVSMKYRSVRDEAASRLQPIEGPLHPQRSRHVDVDPRRAHHAEEVHHRIGAGGRANARADVQQPVPGLCGAQLVAPQACELDGVDLAEDGVRHQREWYARRQGCSMLAPR